MHGGWGEKRGRGGEIIVDKYVYDVRQQVRQNCCQCLTLYGAWRVYWDITKLRTEELLSDAFYLIKDILITPRYDDDDESDFDPTASSVESDEKPPPPYEE